MKKNLGSHSDLMQSINIESVVEDGLCTGCGTCAGVCPQRAIEIHVSKGLLLPEVDLSKCSKCGICVQCCPGFSVDLFRLNYEVFGKQPKYSWLGNFLGCYIGHSKDEEITAVSSSGGIVDQLLTYALENGTVDGALVVRMKSDKPLECEAFLAKTREEVLSASRSKYCPVASGMAIEELFSKKGRFAVVGLPCHIHGIRKAEQVFEELKEKIVLHIGLFCSHTVSQDGTDFILEKLGVKKEEISAFQYRGNSVPDTMVVKLKSGRKVSLKFNKGWNAFWNVFSPFFFTPNRCISCPDHFNELADISVGDAWLPEVTQEHRRESVVVTRTETAENMLASLRRSGLLSLRIVSPDKVIESQAFSVNYKKQTLSGRLHFLNLVGKKTPNISPQPSHSSLFAYAGAFLTVLSLKISLSRSLTSLLVHVPFPLFRLYFGLFKIAFSLSGRGRC